ncbi:hypothetical protein HYALB_00011482 [Hymenoscyphus albidus]|uniref:Nap family protein n=1 Tax=Hymenoscyphus albidus TaxID=595503 RepID=A0A9N9Q870_9HELO|nr:hypothetical protein HYALB_00011482 [Hymenoscyphus albidus]
MEEEHPRNTLLGDLVENDVTYEDLMVVERDLWDAEVEMLRHQIVVYEHIYARRAAFADRIKNFWPLVFEQAPPEIDRYFTIDDQKILLYSLLSFSVHRFEFDTAAPSKGDPRSLSFRFTFKENQFFEETVLEKKFWNRMGKDHICRLVSEPVRITWKEGVNKEKFGNDLTYGVLDLVCDVFEAEKKATNGTPKATKELARLQKELKKEIEKGLGGHSFFAWFGYVGPKISAEESAANTAKYAEKRRKEKAGEVPTEEEIEAAAEEDEDYEDHDESREIFLGGGETLATHLAEELWPDALKFFGLALEETTKSDSEFESDDDDDDGDEDVDEQPAKIPGPDGEDAKIAEDDSDDERPKKKRKN